MKNRWKDDCNRFVLFLDIMGFKARVQRYDHNDIAKGFKKLTRLNVNVESNCVPKANPLLQLVQFSDSILVVSDDTSQDSCMAILKAAVRIMHNGLKCGFPLKGAIAQGRMTFDIKNGIYFGLPLVDAAVLHDELKFYGVAIHHSMEESLRKFLSKSENRYLVQYKPIHLKSGKCSHFCVAYHNVSENLSEGDSKNTMNGYLQRVSRTVSGEPRIYLDNTQAFFSEDNNLEEVLRQ